MSDETSSSKSTASLSDILTAVKNIVTALATEAQNYLNVHGAVNAANISVPTVVKPIAGRIARLSVINAGSATGLIYDGNSLTATTRPLAVIPSAVEIIEINFPFSFGLLIVPGTGQTVSVSYS